jgi:hypothetical protein
MLPDQIGRTGNSSRSHRPAEYLKLMTWAYFGGRSEACPSLRQCPSPLRGDALARQAGAAEYQVVLGRLAKWTTDSDVLSSLVVPQRNPLPGNAVCWRCGGHRRPDEKWGERPLARGQAGVRCAHLCARDRRGLSPRAANRIAREGLRAFASRHGRRKCRPIRSSRYIPKRRRSWVCETRTGSRSRRLAARARVSSRRR